jgi:tRNA A37 threonylcarbamoyladenosine modification protein TsaB
MMRVLALDASTKSTGLAIFDNKELLGKACITASSTDLFNRIHKMVDKIDALINDVGIEQIVMEEVIPDHQKNT